MKLYVINMLWFIAMLVLVIVACFVLILMIDVIKITIELLKEKLNK